MLARIKQTKHVKSIIAEYYNDNRSHSSLNYLILIQKYTVKPDEIFTIIGPRLGKRENIKVGMKDEKNKANLNSKNFLIILFVKCIKMQKLFSLLIQTF